MNVAIIPARGGDADALVSLIAIAQPDIRRYAARNCRAADIDEHSIAQFDRIVETQDGDRSAITRGAILEHAFAAQRGLGSSSRSMAARITSFTPTSGVIGSSVAINGANFTGTTLVTFNGTLENPRLDIEATRPNIDVRVGATTELPGMSMKVATVSRQGERLSQYAALNDMVITRFVDRVEPGTYRLGMRLLAPQVDRVDLPAGGAVLHVAHA